MILDRDNTYKENIDYEKSDLEKNKSKKKILYKTLQLLLITAFVVFLALFINETLIQPYRSKKAMNKIQDLYLQQPAPVTSPIANLISPTPLLSATPLLSPTPLAETNGDASISDEDASELNDNINVNNKLEATDEEFDLIDNPVGILQEFYELLKLNKDTKGWISIKNTYINYPVLQSSNDDPEYYLYRNFFKENDKAGSIFLDTKSSIEDNSRHLVLHGHNMYTTDSMFHVLMEYKKLSFYKKHPIIRFDTIYEKAQWKIFSIFVTNGTSIWEPFFDYTRTDFEDDIDFMNFVYQLRLRSLYNIDSVDVNENDQLLTLSTCSYELNNYRTVIVARKVREGEEITVDLDTVTINPNPLYPKSWYDYYGGKAPSFTSFEEALENGEINWYSGN